MQLFIKNVAFVHTKKSRSSLDLTGENGFGEFNFIKNHFLFIFC